MRMRRFALGAMLIGIIVAGQGCDKKDDNKFKEQAKVIVNLERAIQNESSARKVLEADNKRLALELEMANKELAQRQGMISTLSDKLNDVFGKIADQNEGVYRTPDGALGFSGDVLFASGKVKITAKGKQLLQTIVGELKSHAKAGNIIRIDGHTDNDPVRVVKKEYPTNWHLSVARALAVRDFMEAAGVPKNRMFVAGFGEFWPRVANDTKENKGKNRRVEIRPIEGGVVPGEKSAQPLVK